jgi:hypothetical protein
MHDPRISDVHFKPASQVQRRAGLLGFVRCRLDGRWALDGIRVCETADHRHVLAFPSRRDGLGIEHSFFRPLDNDTRSIIEGAIIGALRREGHLP